MSDPKPIRASVEENGNALVDGVGDSAALTLLWGTWELWADVSSTPSHHGPSAAVSSATPHSNNMGTTPTPGSESTATPLAPPNTTDGLKAPSPLPTRSVSPGTTAEKENWLDQVKSVGLLDSVEGFWGVYDCVLLPSQLPPNSSYYLFRKHIAPMWEHEANRRGGKWMISFTPYSPQVAPPAPGGEEDGETSMAPVDIAWQKLCLACIGELFPGREEEICGVTVTRGKVRANPSGGSGPSGTGGVVPGTSSSGTISANTTGPATGGASSPNAVGGEWKLCLWTRNAEDSVVQMQIAQFIKDLLELNYSPSNGSTPKGKKSMDKPSSAAKNKSSSPFHRNTTEATTPNAPTSTGLHARVMEETTQTGGTPLMPSKPLLVYMAHRDLMQAKQNYAKAGGTVMGPPLKPRYSL